MNYPIDETTFEKIEVKNYEDGKIDIKLGYKPMVIIKGITWVLLGMSPIFVFGGIDDFSLEEIRNILFSFFILSSVFYGFGIMILFAVRSDYKNKIIASIDRKNNILQIYEYQFDLENVEIIFTHYQHRFGHIEKQFKISGLMKNSNKSKELILDKHMLNPVVVKEIDKLGSIPVKFVKDDAIPFVPNSTWSHRVDIESTGSTIVFTIKPQYFKKIRENLTEIIQFGLIFGVIAYFIGAYFFSGTSLEFLIMFLIMAFLVVYAVYLIEKNTITERKLAVKSFSIDLDRNELSIGRESYAIGPNAILRVKGFEKHEKNYLDCRIENENAFVYLPLFSSKEISEKMIQIIVEYLNVEVIR